MLITLRILAADIAFSLTGLVATRALEKLQVTLERKWAGWRLAASTLLVDTLITATRQLVVSIRVAETSVAMRFIAARIVPIRIRRVRHLDVALGVSVGADEGVLRGLVRVVRDLSVCLRHRRAELAVVDVRFVGGGARHASCGVLDDAFYKNPVVLGRVAEEAVMKLIAVASMDLVGSGVVSALDDCRPRQKGVVSCDVRVDRGYLIAAFVIHERQLHFHVAGVPLLQGAR